MVKDSVLNYIVYHSFDPSICIYKDTNTNFLLIDFKFKSLF